METTTEKSVKLPQFDGSRDKFQIWWVRFAAYAMVYKFRKAIKDTADPDLPSSEDAPIDESTAYGKKQAAAKRRNNVAMANLTMAFSSEELMGLIYRSYSTEWPSGLAYKVVQGLFKKFQPQDTITAARGAIC